MKFLMTILLLSSVSYGYSFNKFLKDLSKESKPKKEKNVQAQTDKGSRTITFDSLTDKNRGNTQIKDFSKAKKILEKVYGHNNKTIYCGCNYSGKVVDLASCGLKVIKNEKRATRVEFEHGVPAEVLGRAFPEWYSKQGCSPSESSRKCAGTNPVFDAMEADIYNLFPSEGEINGLRSNYEYTVLTSSKYDTGSCKVKFGDKAFEPRDSEKGMLARASLYMDWAYQGVFNLSDARRKFFQAWDKMYPITEEECKYARIKKQYQGNENPFLKKCY